MSKNDENNNDVSIDNAKPQHTLAFKILNQCLTMTMSKHTILTARARVVTI